MYSHPSGYRLTKEADPCCRGLRRTAPETRIEGLDQSNEDATDTACGGCHGSSFADDPHGRPAHCAIGARCMVPRQVTAAFPSRDRKPPDKTQ